MKRRTKRLLSLLLSLALVAGMIPAFGMTANAEEKPTMILKVTWNSDYSITFQTNHSAGGRSNYGFGIIGEEDGIRHVSTWLGSGELVCDGNTATLPAEEVKKLLAHLDESGRYYAGVWFGDEPEDTYVASVSKLILVNRLPAPGNLHWDGPVAKWDPVDGARGYYVWVYADGHYLRSFDTNETELDLSSYMSVPPAHTYRFDIQTLGPSFDKANSGEIRGPEKLFESLSPAIETQPNSGTCDKDKKYHFSWKVSPSDADVFIDVWDPNKGGWAFLEYRIGYDWAEVSYDKKLAENNISKYRIAAVYNSKTVYSDQFIVTWSGPDPTDRVFVNIEEPVSGRKPATTAWCAGAELKTITWYQETTNERGIKDWTTMSSNSSFREGRKYMAELLLTPGSGYRFAPKSDLNLSLPNTKYLTGGIVSLSESELLLRVEFEASEALINPFVDVYETDEYYDAVLWAYYHDPFITNGIDATHFGPKNTVKRCESVTFLWRMMGCPKPSSYNNPFKDVKSSDYFYEPVLWAVEKGITNGTTATTFAPNDTLTTAHMITFLYRTKNPGKNGWYQEAANWAGNGYGGKPFGVNTAVNNTTNCPRGYVVMFLQKAK